MGTLPVCEVQPDNYDGRTRTIHRNLLPPCDFLPVEQPAPTANYSRTEPSLLQQNSNPNDSSDSDSEAEIDPDLSGAHPFSRRNRTDVPSGQALSSTADETPPGWQRPRDRADRQDALLTIAWDSRQCMLAQLLTRRPYDHVTVELSRHITVGLVQLTGRPLGG